MQLVEHPPSVATWRSTEASSCSFGKRVPARASERSNSPRGSSSPERLPAAPRRASSRRNGLGASSYREVGSFWAVPAYSTEYVHVFEATGLTSVPPAAMDPDEDVEVERVPVEKAIERVSDAVSLAALALWQRRR